MILMRFLMGKAISICSGTEYLKSKLKKNKKGSEKNIALFKAIADATETKARKNNIKNI